MMNCIHIQCTALCPSWSLIKIWKNLQSQLPFHLFITGGAGVGKTFKTKILIAYLQLFCTAQLNTNSVVVCAPTGTAASHINGQTIHSLFKIPIAQHLTYSSLSGFTLKKTKGLFSKCTYCYY